ncbi:hypothetical protein CHS0354_015232 [Potamilus streckersoni]|uniref:Uncharacterized protein n=1 Tax=Potamilus streckersoni TaxID=2493646 RepID=A0AAE0RRV4_9BIVA|nr:hypothetical protein CHS0354_015232 [Potamilus streckersoni]
MKHARKCSRYSTVDYGLLSEPTRKLSKHCSVDSCLPDTTKKLSKSGRVDVEPTHRHYKKNSKHSHSADGVCIPRIKVKTARRKSSITTLNSPSLSSRKPSLISLKQTGSSDVPSLDTIPFVSFVIWLLKY